MVVRTGRSLRPEYELWQLPSAETRPSDLCMHDLFLTPRSIFISPFQIAYNLDPTAILRIPNCILDGRHAFDFHLHHIPSLQKFLVEKSHASRRAGHDDGSLAKSDPS